MQRFIKTIIVTLILVFISPNLSFAEWLGWKRDDGAREGFVLLYKNENLGNNASSGEELRQMVIYGDASMIDYGTNCYVLETKFGKAKVRITSGLSAGAVGWVYEEYLREGTANQKYSQNYKESPKKEQVEKIKKDPLFIEGIVYDKNPSVIIGDKLYQQGDSVESFRIKEIGRDYVEFMDSTGGIFRKNAGSGIK